MCCVADLALKITDNRINPYLRNSVLINKPARKKACCGCRTCDLNL